MAKVRNGIEILPKISDDDRRTGGRWHIANVSLCSLKIIALSDWGNVWWYVQPFRHRPRVWQTDRQTDNLQTDGRTDKQNASSGITWRRWLAYRWSEPTFWVELGGLIQLQTGSRPCLGLDDWRDSNLSNVPTRGGVCLLWVTHRSIRHAAVKHSAVAVPWPELPCKL